MTDPIAPLIARLLAERWLPRDDTAVRQVLVDAELRDDLDRRLAGAGLRLLEHPYAAHVAVGIARAQEADVFGHADAWAASNLQLSRDALALLVVVWSLLVLPKRQRQIARQARDRAQDQEQMFAELKPVPVGAEVVEPINERTLLADFGDKLGGKARIQMNLGTLQRHGFIVRRRERIHEGPLLDLAIDYERIAGRVTDGALAYVLAEARDGRADGRADDSDDGRDARAPQAAGRLATRDPGAGDESYADPAVAPDAAAMGTAADDASTSVTATASDEAHRHAEEATRDV